MEIVTVISIMTAVALGILLWNRHTAIRKLEEDLKWQRDANMQLLKQEPAKNEVHACMEPLNVAYSFHPQYIMACLEAQPDDSQNTT